MNDQRTVAGREANKKLWAAERSRLLSLSKFKVGQRVLIPSRFGMHVAADIPATIERVDFDHTHAGGHQEECFQESRISYSLVWGAKPDGTAALRTREHSAWLVVVKEKD